MSNEELVLVDSPSPGVFVLTLNAPKVNALSTAMLSRIHYLATDLTILNARAVVITGGDRLFAAGADISEFVHFNIEQATRMSADGHDVMNAIENGTKVVLAAVNGFALGGGCELAMACHLRIASSNAKFGQPEVNLGVPPGYGGTQRLVQLVGKGKALELLLTGDAIDAQTALSLGLVNKVVDQAELIEESKKMLSKIIGKSPSAVNKVIKCVNDYFRPNVNGMQREIYEFGEAFETADFKEGTDAFLNKRKPSFRD